MYSSSVYKLLITIQKNLRRFWILILIKLLMHIPFSLQSKFFLLFPYSLKIVILNTLSKYFFRFALYLPKIAHTSYYWLQGKSSSFSKHSRKIHQKLSKKLWQDEVDNRHFSEKDLKSFWYDLLSTRNLYFVIMRLMVCNFSKYHNCCTNYLRKFFTHFYSLQSFL